jgi:NADH dehydrogenase/NADH:ubiquinone oxidoreductase subunit G
MSETQKPKKTLSADQLEKLKVAREKALTVRQTNAKNKALEKELATAEKEQHLNTVKEKLAKVKATGNADGGATLRSKQEAPKIEVVESEPESEPEIVVKRTKKPSKKKKIVIVEDSDTDEDQQQVIFVRRKKDNPLQPIQRPAPEPVPQQVFKQAPSEPQHPDINQMRYDAMFNAPRRF